jgi:putative heme-binding domain-containing protein
MSNFTPLFRTWTKRPNSIFSALLGAGLIVASTRPASGEAIGKITLPAGFRAELVYEVPAQEQGSWVCLAVDHKGRIYAADQYGAIYRVEPSPLGAAAAQTKVEKIGLNIGGAQGLLPYNDQLYFVMNGRMGAFGTGLYRLSDTDGDDRLDRMEQLRIFQGDGEHGPHAVLLGPDGKSLYLIAGNFTKMPIYSRALPTPVWGEDQLLPRIYDPNGHANELLAPGGWIARTDLEGKNFEVVSVGYRNAYDMAFNADGELFTFDSDMEWDIGTPWYRPTRICHVVSGSEWGWRSGNGPWPPHWPDTLPPAADVGPGSPTGMTFGAGAKFPERYQQALFCGDWSYGNIYAIHLATDGASYRGEVERFASAMPLGVTDIVVRPQDGALYFAVGGRRSASALYRIVADDTAGAGAIAASPVNHIELELQAQRRELEKLHAGPQAGAVEKAWPELSNTDRFVRYAARVAIEHQPADQWRERARTEQDPKARAQALLAWARTASSGDHAAWVDAVVATDVASAPLDVQLDFLRAAAVGAIRFDSLSAEQKKKLLAKFDPMFPAGDYPRDRDLANLLIRLGAENLVPRLLDVLHRAVTPEEAIDAAISLSVAPGPWTVEQRGQLLDWFDESAARGGGLSFFGYIVSARQRFIDRIPADQRGALTDRIAKPLVQQVAAATETSRPFVKEWTLAELVAAAEADSTERDLANGRRMFAAANCYNCHRVAGEGSSVGPDLTGVGRRFGAPDILRSIVEPNHEISDQYRQMVFETNGRVIVGRVSNMNNDEVMVSVNMLDPKNETRIRRDEIDEQYPSDASIMPGGLLNTLSQDEILDLLAYLRSAGVPAAVAAGPASAAAGE